MAIATLPFIGGPESEDLIWPKPRLTLVTDDFQRAFAKAEPRTGLEKRVVFDQESKQTRRKAKRRMVLWTASVTVALLLLALPSTTFGAVTVSGQATPGGSTAGLADGSVYVVNPGDTLSSIAQRINPGRSDQIARQMAANIGSSTVVAGEHIVLP